MINWIENLCYTIIDIYKPSTLFQHLAAAASLSPPIAMALRTLSSKKTLAGLGFRQARSLQTFSLPDLPYDYGALEPAISGEIMKIHHQKHHQTYITNYNKALEQLDEAMAKGDASKVVHLQSAIKFNSGG